MNRKAWTPALLSAGLLVGCVADTANQQDDVIEGCDDAPLLGRQGQTITNPRDFAWEQQTSKWSLGEAITYRVPADLTGLTIIVVDGERETGVAKVTNNGETLLDVERDDPDLEGVTPHFHIPDVAGAVTFPIDAHSSLSEGCLTVVPTALKGDDSAANRSREGKLYMVSRRHPPGGEIDVNAVIVGETTITAQQIETTFGVVKAALQAGGAPTIGLIHTKMHPWESTVIPTEGSEIHKLRASYSTQDQKRLNIYFVQDFDEEGTLGFAAGMPGPNGVHGTARSGLVISVDTHLDENEAIDTKMMGETIAHEIGHQLGLFHTTEEDGEQDVLEDTAECTKEQHDADRDGKLSAEECERHGAHNLMFWTAFDDTSQSQRELSATQTKILSVSPIARQGD